MAFRPLRYSSDAVFEMSNSEIDYLVYRVLREFALDNSGLGSLNINGFGNNVGRFRDTRRVDQIFTHPTDGSLVIQDYNLRQQYGIASNPNPVRPVHFEDNALREMTNSELNQVVISRAVNNLLNDGIGSYVLTTSSGINSYSGSYTLIATVKDTRENAQNGAANENNVAVYRLTPTAPSNGTWRQTGTTITDTRQQVGNVNYVSNVDYVSNSVSNVDYVSNSVSNVDYVGAYVGSKTYVGAFGSSTVNYVGTSTYTGNFVSATGFTGNYVSATGFTGNYVSATNFTAQTILSDTETVTSLKLWIKIA